MNRINLVYPDLLSQHRHHQTITAKSLSLETLKKIHYVVTDPGYDDKSLYDLSMKMGFQLECRGLVKRYSIKYFRRKTRILIDFYESALRSGNLFEDKYIYKTAD